ncbi:MAG: DUF5666 domain-containing protein [Armatimonas sp.]
MKRTYALTGLLALLALAPLGCGTSSTPTPPTLGGDSLGDGSARGVARPEEAAPVKASDPLWESRRLPLLLTASGKPQGIERVYATIHKIELLTGQGDEAVAVLQDDAGINVELCSLDGKLLPLGTPPIKVSKPISRVRITLAAGLMRFGQGSATGEQVLLPDALPKDAAGHPTITLSLEKTQDPTAGPATLTVDLAKLATTGDHSPLALTVASSPKGDTLSREWTGVVRGVQGEAPQQKVLLGSELVTLSPTTVVLGDGTPAPKLAEGQKVRVRATLDSARRALVATQVSLGVDTGASVRGKVVSVDPGAQTLTLTVDEVTGAMPGQNTLLVSLAEKAAIYKQGGLSLSSEELWRSLVSGASVQLEGAYEPVSGALAAIRLVLESAGPSLVTLTAPVSGGDNAALQLGAPTAWSGFLPAAKGGSLALRENTQLFDDSGTTLKADAFVGLAKERGVKAIGMLGKDGKLTASRLDLLPKAVATPEPKPTPTPAPAPAKSDAIPEKTDKTETDKATDTTKTGGA